MVWKVTLKYFKRTRIVFKNIGGPSKGFRRTESDCCLHDPARTSQATLKTRWRSGVWDVVKVCMLEPFGAAHGSSVAASHAKRLPRGAGCTFARFGIEFQIHVHIGAWGGGRGAFAPARSGRRTFRVPFASWLFRSEGLHAGIRGGSVVAIRVTQSGTRSFVCAHAL